MKKIIFTLSILFVLTQVIIAQSNLDFESWNGTEPNGWESSNSTTMAAGGDQTVFKEAADPSEGNFSLKLVTGSCPDCPNYAPLGPFIPLPLPDPMGGVIQLGSYLTPGIPYTDRPVSVDLDYKAMPMANDYAVFYVELLKYDAIADTSEVIGEASFDIGSQVPNWTHVSIPFVYHSTETPNRIDIYAASSVGAIPDFSALSPFPLPVFPSPVAGSTLFIDDIQFTLPSCNGLAVSVNGMNESSPLACDGQIAATANGGTPPYSYLWDEIPPITTPTITGLCPGIYEVEVLDANGCFDIQTYTVLHGSCGGFNISMNSTNASSPTASDGSATATITGGAPPYNVLWSNGTFTSSAGTVSTINNLGVGTYGIEVADASGYCIWIGFTTVWGPGGGPVSISEIKETQIVHAHPNPSSGMFSIEIGEQIERISVYNQLGEEVYQAAGNSEFLSLDLTNQSTGIYFFQIKSKNGYSTGKLIIQ